VPVQLNTNENPYGPSEATARDIADAVFRAATELNRYPDREAADLRAALADYLGHGLTADNLWAANGSNEVMQQILQAFGGPGRTALSFAPTYSMYPEYARNTHTRWVEGRRRDDFSIDVDAAVELIAREKPEVVFLASPNNPTGTAIDPAELRAIIEAAPGVVVVDEAYAEFRRTGTPTALELLPEFPRLLVTRTMSKAFAFAGRRLGYVAADPAIIDGLLADGELEKHQLAHAARADFCRRLGRHSEARKSYERAIELTSQGPAKRFLEKRLAALHGAG
jgi:histidinol-phosphate aminotransferase